MRPTTHCAKCIKDLNQDCEHLALMYDRAMLKGLTEQDLIVYALNRMWALERDNSNKAAGDKASRIYKSRNEVTNNALAKKCDTWRGALRCMRNTGHEGDHKF